MNWEMFFFWGALLGYVASSICYFYALIFLKHSDQKAGIITAFAGLLLHSVSLGIRWSITGHGPYVSTFEILSSNVWIVVAFYLIFQRMVKRASSLGGLVMTIGFIMLGFALMGSTEVRELTPTLRSGWLVVHIVFAKLTVAAIVVAVALSVFFLLTEKGELVNKHGLKFLEKLPSPILLDDYSYRLVAFGFITLTIMIITGSIWANNSWGSYWAWDPTETWSLVVWFVYGLFLHGRITFRWQGKISAWFIIAAFVFSLVAFFVLPYFVKSLHSQYMVG